jgi:hypothetical protein
MSDNLADELKIQREERGKINKKYTTPKRDETIIGYSAFYRRAK